MELVVARDTLPNPRPRSALYSLNYPPNLARRISLPWYSCSFRIFDAMPGATVFSTHSIVHHSIVRKVPTHSPSVKPFNQNSLLFSSESCVMNVLKYDEKTGHNKDMYFKSECFTKMDYCSENYKTVRKIKYKNIFVQMLKDVCMKVSFRHTYMIRKL